MKRKGKDTTGNLHGQLTQPSNNKQHWKTGEIMDLINERHSLKNKNDLEYNPMLEAEKSRLIRSGCKEMP